MMKALIFNSGTGSRMGRLTENCPKCLLKLPDSETVLSRQLRILSECGIRHAVITTGKYTDQIVREARKNQFIETEFVENPYYDKTNYIYSMYLARNLIDDDILMLHGDLVFDKTAVMNILADSECSHCMTDETAPLPQKDFKGRITEGYLREVSVNIFDSGCFALQPLYKLTASDMRKWMQKTSEFISAGKYMVYAEEALNEILSVIKITPVSYNGCFISEIDNEKDYRKVSYEIANFDAGNYTDFRCLRPLIEKFGVKRPFVVCGRHCIRPVTELISSISGIDPYICTDYKENPDEESIEKAAQLFRDHKADILISVGGGSVIDTAKAVKALTCSTIRHIAVPTTAGSGSEATQFAAVYKDKIKYSLDSKELQPGYVILDSTLLYTLGYNQKMISLLDTVCHCIESLLSVRGNETSRKYVSCAAELIKNNYDDYRNSEKSACSSIMLASHYAGRAIQISRTSAGHAMSYVLTAQYGIRHGQAAAVCLKNILNRELTCSCPEVSDLRSLLIQIYEDACFDKIPLSQKPSARELSSMVNSERLENFPVKLTSDDIDEIYENVIDDLFTCDSKCNAV